MATRAKFRVDYKSKAYAIDQYLSNEGKSGMRAVQDIILSPVSGDGVEENKEFFASTPNGSIRLVTTNPDAAGEFIQGKEYYVDFTLAE